MTTPTPGSAGNMPVIFLAHGSPLLLDDGGWVNELGAWAAALPRPKAVLMLSAHWVDQPITLGATDARAPRLRLLRLPGQVLPDDVPGAARAGAGGASSGTSLRAEPVAQIRNAACDHGAYVPLVAMYPNADVPVLQASLPSLDPTALFSLGRALAPLRREGVLIVGSGFLTHNLRTVDFRPGAPTPAWASEFDRLGGRRARPPRRRRVAGLPGARAGCPPGAADARALRPRAGVDGRRHRRHGRHGPLSDHGLRVRNGARAAPSSSAKAHLTGSRTPALRAGAANAAGREQPLDRGVQSVQARLVEHGGVDGDGQHGIVRWR